MPSITTLWSAIQADLPRWICTAIKTMGLPANARGPSIDSLVPSASIAGSGRVRAALAVDADLQTAAVAEVYMALHRGLARNAVPADLDNARAWLCVTTTRVARRLATRQAPFTAAVELSQDIDWGASPANDPERVASTREQLGKVQLALGALTPLDREIAHAIADGETPDEIATRLGLNPNSVRSRLFRLRKSLTASRSPTSEGPPEAA